jgi:hypothetical protein
MLRSAAASVSKSRKNARYPVPPKHVPSSSHDKDCIGVLLINQALDERAYFFFAWTRMENRLTRSELK